MLLFMKLKPALPKWLELITNVLGYRKLCSNKLKRRIEHECGVRRLLIYTSIIAPIFVCLPYGWRGADGQHFFLLFIIEKFVKGIVITVIFVGCFLYPVFVATVSFNASIYGCTHIYLQLLILADNLEKLNVRYTENENYQLHNDQYQKIIRRKLILCWEQYLNIRRLKALANDTSYWPIYSGYMHAILIMGTSCIYFLLGGHPSENPGIVLTPIFVWVQILLFLEHGQYIKNESENIHIALGKTQWYQWNTENRKFLLIFLIATEEPMQIESFCCTQSREIYVKVFTGLYSIITCINTLRNRT